MHRSQFAGLIIDCKADDLNTAADFWSSAMGYPKKTSSPDGLYVELDVRERDIYMEVQKVAHESRVHLDIETDDIEAEAMRLERLGAKRITEIKSWLVMEAPTGQRFCLVPPVSKRFKDSATVWEQESS